MMKEEHKEKSLTIIIRTTPNQLYLPETQDLILSQSAFFDQLNLIFLGCGILQLLKNQTPFDPSQKNISHIYKTFELYDIESVYIDNDACKHFNIKQEDLLIPGRIINKAEIQTLLAESSLILSA